MTCKIKTNCLIPIDRDNYPLSFMMYGRDRKAFRDQLKAMVGLPIEERQIEKGWVRITGNELCFMYEEGTHEARECMWVFL